MKKRILSCLMALALCLTLLPTAALAEEPEGTAQTSPAVEEAADPENGKAKQENQPAAPEQEGQSTEQEEQQEDSATKQDEAVAAVQAMIDALPDAAELDGMDDEDAMAVYEAFQTACDAYYDTLTEEQQAQLKNTEKLAALSERFSQLETLAAEDTHTHCVCGAEHNGNITTHGADDKTKFATKLYSTSGKYQWFIQKPDAFSSTPLELRNNQWVLTEGCYYLADDSTNSGCTEHTFKIEGNVTICLNGKKIEKTGAAIGPVFEVPTDSTLTLTNCKDTGKDTGIMFDYSSDGTGSGVYVNGGTLNLYSGQITKSKGQQQGEYNDHYGGGVYVTNGGNFNMYGGTITKNDADYGGGVYVNGTNSTFTMNGNASVTGNNSSKGSGSFSGGGGVYVSGNGTFEMNDSAKVTENTIGYASNGGGVYVSGTKSTFTMNGNASVTGNKATSENNSGGGVYMDGGTFTMNGNASVKNNKTANTYATLKGGGVYMDGGTFNMNGTSSVTENAASGNKKVNGDGGGVYVNGGEFNMNDGAIRGNTATGSGGGVYMDGGMFTMKGGTIGSGNTATGSGGGVYMNDGTFTMKGSASIIGNKTANDTYGGGVYVSGNGTFNMNDTASITDNTANQGGGVYVNGTFNMNGNASIKSNTGSGVCVGYNNAKFTVSGAATVMGNTRENATSNVYLTGSAYITISNQGLNDGASIGVTKTVDGGVIAKNVSADYSGKFFSDDTRHKVEYDETKKQLVLTKSAVTHTHEWTFTKETGNDSKIFVFCKGTPGSCDYKTTPATVTISMAKTTYPYSENMETPTAKLTYSDNWPSEVKKAKEADIEYYKLAVGGTSYTVPVLNKDELKNPGKYLAQLRFNGTYYLVVHFSVVDSSKQDPTYTAPTAKTGLVYNGENQPLINEGSTNDGRMWYRLSTDSVYSTLVPTGKDAGEYIVYYKVEGNDGYNDVAEQSIRVYIDKAKLSGTPGFTKVTGAGKTLKDVTLTKADGWPDGEFKWGNGVLDVDETAPLVQGKAYSWLYIAKNHYASGTVVPWPADSGNSSGGGGGSSSGSSDSNPVIKTETKNHADGSTTKTETRKDGSVTQTTTGKDGSVSKTETKKDGSSVTENKAADGSTGTVKTDKNGQTEAKTALSSKAIEDAKRNGEAVKAPVEVKATRNSSTAPTVKVELPQNSGETKVEIPVSNVTPGTVAVLVHPDGTEEIVKNSLPTENGIQLTVNGNATVKIVDNSKGFIDTQDHWAKDAIDFVSARGLVSGMSATIYAPNNSTTRAQLWTILARQNDVDLSGGANWYEKAQLWSKDKGVSDGTNPNAAINRAQMVTMLWRAAGQSAAAGSAANFTDVPTDSYYAQAVAWAVENGITAGVGGGRFDPTAPCTRAQIATFLARSMK